VTNQSLVTSLCAQMKPDMTVIMKEDVDADQEELDVNAKSITAQICALSYISTSEKEPLSLQMKSEQDSLLHSMLTDSTSSSWDPTEETIEESSSPSLSAEIITSTNNPLNRISRISLVPEVMMMDSEFKM